tara:strand:- start:120 stop:380 length:261 start_codon:yes stop_codon:yes gene_type:complete
MASPLADQTFLTETFFDSLNCCFATVSLRATVAYRYDALSRRMAKEIDLGRSVARTTYAYDGGAQVLGEFLAGGQSSLTAGWTPRS